MLTVLAVSILSGCATKEQTYKPPDPTEVRKATKAVKEGIQKSRASVKEARAHIEDAQKNADTISTLSLTLHGKIDALAQIAPPELQPPIAEIRLDVEDLQKIETVLTNGLVQAWQKNDEASTHLAETDKHEGELEQKQLAYYTEAQKLADNATDENKHRIDAEKKLSWYRWHWWGSWIVLGAGVVVCVIAAILKWGAKWGAKVAVAGAKIGL